MPSISLTFNQPATNTAIDGVGKYFELTPSAAFPPAGSYQITGATVFIRKFNTYNASASFLMACPGQPDMMGSPALSAWGYGSDTIYSEMSFGLPGWGGSFPDVRQVFFKKTGGSGTYVFQLRAGGQIEIAIEYTATTSACTAPSEVKLSAALAEGNVVLTGSGAAGGINNGLTGYQVQYRDGDGAWTDYTTILTASGSFSLSVSPPDTRGVTRRFRARTIGSAGGSFYSGYRETAGGVKRNEAPTAPAAISASPALWEGGSIAVSWQNGSDGDGNLSHYEAEYAVNDGAWVLHLSTAAQSFSHSPALSRGDRIRYRVRAVDAFGIKSGNTLSAYVTKNRLPNAPRFVLPVSGAVTVSLKPAVEAAAGTEPDGQAQTLKVAADSGAFAAITKRTALSLGTGSHTLRLYAEDALGAKSGEVQATLTVMPLSWAREIKQGTAIEGHRADLAELRDQVNIIRAYYGLEAMALPGEVGVFAHWQGQMQALQQGLPGSFQWQAVPAYPQAAIVNQLRQAVVSA